MDASQYKNFENAEKLDKGKDKIDLLTNLLNIFNKPELDFSKKQNRER